MDLVKDQSKSHSLSAHSQRMLLITWDNLTRSGVLLKAGLTVQVIARTCLLLTISVALQFTATTGSSTLLNYSLSDLLR